MAFHKKKMFSGADALLFKRASELRGNQTFTEELLGNYLKTKPFGYKFRRQQPFSHYILDFYCHKLKLVTEVDGPIHNLEEIKKADEVREAQLKKNGLTIMRFTNDEIRLQPETVIQQIEANLQPKN